jgi:flavin-dependent dehydrogenase
VADPAEHGCVIVGASFAGLACARELAGHGAVLVDRRPLGSGETSACAAPLRTIRFLGAEDAVREVHDHLGMYIGRRRYPLPLPEPFCTFDYATLCRTVAGQTDAPLLAGNAEAARDGVVTLADGPELRGRFVVDAAGWRRTLDPAGPLTSASEGLSYGAEEHVEYPDARRARGLDFVVDRALVRRGYGWNFPAGDHARCGVGAFERGPLQPPMAVVREREALGAPVRRHGGVIPHRLLPPVSGGILFIGDAAGHCLPLSAEGIRAAVYFGTAAGRLIAASLRGELPRAEALRRYAALHEAEARHYAKLLRAQRAIPDIAPRTLAAVSHLLKIPRVHHWLVRRYLSHLVVERLGAVPSA